MLLKRSTLAFPFYVASVVSTTPLNSPTPSSIATVGRLETDSRTNNGTSYVPPLGFALAEGIAFSLINASKEAIPTLEAVLKDGFAPPAKQAAPDIIQKIIDKWQSHRNDENNNKIKKRSNDDDGDACEVTSDEAGDLSYEYRPDDCANPPDQDTLEKGLEEALKIMNDTLALVACFKGGRLEGVLQLAINPSHILEGQCDDADYE
ncbi:MAG: hypothetical protein LQ342_007797 [Letrouitia transgressa]|nr:MAG: hypothetical protein LQ342_007797 [Letrouitia transgressa]